MLSGLSQINIELTSRCNKHTLCAFCFHQSNLALRRGDMPMDLVKHIRRQLSPGTLTVKYHRDGDALAYQDLGEALDVFDGFIRSIVTHGETLHERANELIGRCEAVTVSVFYPDADSDLQYESVLAFVRLKGTRLPRVLIKLVGAGDVSRYEALGLPVLHRKLHTELNERYVRTAPVLPESGICGDFLGNPAIAWDGKVYQCVRFDATDEGYLGSLYEHTLDEIWNSARRKEWLAHHVAGQREKSNARCASCTYFGIPVAA